MDALSLFIVNILKENYQIPENECEIYAYLFSYIMEGILLDVSLLIIGIISGNIINTICYLLTTLPLRHFSGGFHANTKLGCSILSYGHYILIIFIIPLIPMNSILLGILYIICWCITLSVAPVDTQNKRLTKLQRKTLRRRCIITFFVITLINILLWLNHNTLYYTTITVCVIINTLGLLTGILKNRRIQ